MFMFSTPSSQTFPMNLDDRLLFFGIRKLFKISGGQSSFDFMLTYSGTNQLDAILGNQQYVEGFVVYFYS